MDGLPDEPKDDLPYKPSYWDKPSSPRLSTPQGSPPVPEEQPLDPRPRAAYLLGYLSFGVWFFHKLLWKLADEESVRANVLLAIAQLRSAMDALVVEIHPNVSYSLGRAITEFEAKTKGLQENVWVKDPDAYRSSAAPFKPEWEVVKSLADQALDVTRELRPLYDLGSALGELRLKLWEWGPGSILDQAELARFYEWIGNQHASDAWPDVRPLVRAALRLPPGVLDQIPPVKSLVELANLSESDERGLFLTKFLDEHPELCPRHQVGGEVDHAIASAMADSLHVRIRADLASSFSKKSRR